jgi:hypothetical protein
MTLLPALAVMLGIGILLRVLLKNKPVAVRMIPLQVLAVIIVLLEIGKQVLSLQRGYDLYHLPFHFCSLFIFSLPVMAFYKGKYCQTVRGIGAALCASLMLLMLIYPNLIYGSWNIEGYFQDFLNFHTVTYHGGVVFAFLLTLALQVHTPQSRKEPGAVVLVMAVFCAISSVAAQLLKTNYANFYQCNIPPLEALRQTVQSALGYVPAQILYVLIVSALTIGFTYGTYWLYRGIRNLTTKKAPV